MAISQTKQAQLTTPEAVYDQPPAPRPNGTNSGKSGLSAGAITGIAVSGVVACALSFVVGMQVGGTQNGMNNQAGGPPSMSRSQNSQQGGPGGQTGGAPGGSQNQTGQSSQVPAGQNNNGTAQNNQAAPSGQSGSPQPSTANTAPQAN
ncbi:hypothetical protein V4210_04155 [Candidatus Nanosynbacter sp. BB002]|uniref:hypothetical protein n=1 Tax=Candidatus Nanosynbacter sp. BB002 TaxID=3393757 RepID=UPI0030D0CA2C